MTEPMFLSRRDVLRLGGVAAVTAALGGSLVACSPAGGGNEIQYMFWGSTGEQKAVQGMLASFAATKKKSALSVKPLYTPDDYDTKLNALVASGRVPDIAYINSPMAFRLAEQGHLVDLKPYFDKYPSLAQRLPVQYNFWTEEKTMGTPAASEIMVLWTNKKAFAEAGIDTPPVEAAKAWNWDRFVEAAVKLTKDRNGNGPDSSKFDQKNVARFGTLANMWSAAWYGLLLSAGADIVDESGTTTMLNSGEAITMFQNLVDLMYEHRVAPSPTQLGNNAPSLAVQLNSNRVGMAIDGQWALLDISTSGADYGVGVLPSYGTPTTATTGGAIGIFTKTKHIDEVLELYIYQSDPTKVPLFASGLWMPIDKKYYTDDAEIAKWTDNKVHPPEYRTAVVDYALNNSVRYFAERMKNYEAIDKLITPAMEQLQGGKQKVPDVLNTLAGKLNDGALKGFYPNPML